MAENNRDSVVTTGSWFLFLLVLAIPIVGFIIFLVEAFGSGSNRNKQGLCRAILIWWIIGVVFTIIVAILFGAGLSEALKDVDLNNLDLGQMMEDIQQNQQEKLSK